jgi:excisionase family DNA binding protein
MRNRTRDDWVDRARPRVSSASRRRPIGRLRTIPETAEILQTSTRTVQRFIARGELRAHRIGRLVRIWDSDITAFLDANLII